MAVRIQLASNFQVVELTYDDWSEVNYQEVADATAMVNRLGSEIVNDIKKPTNNGKKEKEEMATQNQIKALNKFCFVKGTTFNHLTKKDAWQLLQAFTNPNSKYDLSDELERLNLKLKD